MIILYSSGGPVGPAAAGAGSDPVTGAPSSAPRVPSRGVREALCLRPPRRPRRRRLRGAPSPFVAASAPSSVPLPSDSASGTVSASEFEPCGACPSSPAGVSRALRLRPPRRPRDPRERRFFASADSCGAVSTPASGITVPSIASLPGDIFDASSGRFSGRPRRGVWLRERPPPRGFSPGPVAPPACAGWEVLALRSPRPAGSPARRRREAGPSRFSVESRVPFGVEVRSAARSP
jgi:hypothetical protein